MGSICAQPRSAVTTNLCAPCWPQDFVYIDIKCPRGPGKKGCRCNCSQTGSSETHCYMPKLSQGVWGRAVLELSVFREPAEPREEAGLLSSGVVRHCLSQAPGPGRAFLEEGTAYTCNRGRRRLSLSRELPMTQSSWALGSGGESRSGVIRTPCIWLGGSCCVGKQGGGRGVA